MSLLQNGKIPAQTMCPLRERCEIVVGGSCHHKGVEHQVQFSCADARAFDMVSKRAQERSNA